MSALDEVVFNGRRTKKHYSDAAYELRHLRAELQVALELVSELKQAYSKSHVYVDEHGLVYCAHCGTGLGAKE